MRAHSILVLTTGIRGDDGLSLLSREVVSTLDRLEPRPEVEVWSLTDEPLRGSGVRCARGSRFRFGMWGLEEGFSPQRGRAVFTLHAHLLPVTLPVVQRGASLVHFLVGIEAWKPLSRLQLAALRRSTRLVAVSGHSEAEFRKANPSFAGAEVSVCHPGLPELGGEDDSTDGGYALIVGRMSKKERYKGHDLLLEIWSDIMRRHPGAELVVVGGGDDLPRLQNKAAALGLGTGVCFLGHVPAKELDRLYRRCIFFVMPSRHEGFGFVFLEAMRAGKACICARGAASEIIEDGVTGIVVDPDRADEVISAIQRLLADPRSRREMGSLAKARFLEHFTRERFAERLRVLLRT